MTSEQKLWRSATSWGTEKLTREELLTLGPMLHRAWDACVRVANRSVGAQMREFFAVGSEMCGLSGRPPTSSLSGGNADCSRRPVRNGGRAMSSDQNYEWLLSDHPDARAEQTVAARPPINPSDRAAQVQAWAAKIKAAPDATQAMRQFADSLGPSQPIRIPRRSGDCRARRGIRRPSPGQPGNLHASVGAGPPLGLPLPVRYIGEAEPASHSPT